MTNPCLYIKGIAHKLPAYKIYYVCFAVALSCLIGNAQQIITIDWDSRQPTSPPITVDRETPVTVSIIHVNDMLYSYSARVAAHAREPNDVLSGIQAGRPSPGAPTPPDACKDLSGALDALDTSFDKPELNPQKGVTIPRHIALGMTIAAYEAAKITISQLDAKTGACADASLLKRKTFYLTMVKVSWDAAEAKSHVFTFPTTLEPLNDYSIYIQEDYKGSMTDACTDQNKAAVECEIKYSPVTNIVTASGGFLITMLPSRTYERRNVPGSSNGVLVVTNGGPIRTAFAALVNVKLPVPKYIDKVCLSEDTTFGCAISVGPAFDIGSGNQGATRVGLLAGLSFHLWRYFYVTPATHIGQFADFPVGFTHSGQFIPSSFTGNLQSVPRITARFALALTFKGWNLLTKNSTSQGVTTPRK